MGNGGNGEKNGKEEGGGDVIGHENVQKKREGDTKKFSERGGAGSQVRKKSTGRKSSGGKSSGGGRKRK